MSGYQYMTEVRSTEGMYGGVPSPGTPLMHPLRQTSYYPSVLCGQWAKRPSRQGGPPTALPGLAYGSSCSVSVWTSSRPRLDFGPDSVQTPNQG